MTLPSSISSLTKLSDLSISDMILQDGDRSLNVCFLKEFSFHFPQIILESESLPFWITNLSNLSVLCVENCNLVCSLSHLNIPPSFPHLRTLRLSRNTLSGPIPMDLSTLTRLRVLDLGYTCNLTGF